MAEFTATPATFSRLPRSLRNEECIKIAIHAFTDGRDTSPTSGLGFVSDLEAELERTNSGRVVSVCGRYFAMDRDKRWERTQAAYDLITAGIGNHAPDVRTAIESAYANGVTDEFIEPTIVGEPIPLSQTVMFSCLPISARIVDAS